MTQNTGSGAPLTIGEISSVGSQALRVGHGWEALNTIIETPEESEWICHPHFQFCVKLSYLAADSLVLFSVQMLHLLNSIIFECCARKEDGCF